MRKKKAFPPARKTKDRPSPASGGSLAGAGNSKPDVRFAKGLKTLTGKVAETPRGKTVVAHDKPLQRKSFPVVGIGASAGGLEAFTELLHHLPSQTGMALVLVQHLDPTHASILTELLSKTTRLPVKEARNGMALKPDHVYVIPPNTKMTVRKGALRLVEGKRESAAQHSIDHFLESLAREQGPQAVGVVLSRSASDGTVGLEAIKSQGGITFAQDSSAKYESMPRSAIAAGCVDFVLPPAKIASELATIIVPQPSFTSSKKLKYKEGFVSIKGRSKLGSFE
jgi:two-component system CheB/CheR fusion protein